MVCSLSVHVDGIAGTDGRKVLIKLPIRAALCAPR